MTQKQWLTSLAEASGISISTIEDRYHVHKWKSPAKLCRVPKNYGRPTRIHGKTPEQWAAYIAIYGNKITTARQVNNYFHNLRYSHPDITPTQAFYRFLKCNNILTQYLNR